MDANELRKMLGLTPDAVKPQQAGNGGLDMTGFTEFVSDEPEAGISEHALAVDKWDIAQGESLAKDLDHNDPAAVTDFHTAYFQQVPILDEDGCVDPKRYEFIETLLETPEYKALHTQTQSNQLASRVAAAALAKEYEVLEGKRTSCVVNGEETTLDPNAQGKMGAAMAASAAVQEAQSQVDELEDMQRALGAGGAGTDAGTDGQMDFAAIQQQWDRVRNDWQLRRIIELAGRYRRVAQAKQRAKAQHGYDDMVGVELAGDIGRLLPVELSKLADEDLELDTLRRIVERQAYCREYQGTEKVGKGPIIVCVDESSSMSGEPLAKAKAFALAMAWVAKHQRRYCALVSYSGSNCPGHVVVLRPGKWDESKLMDWLTHNYAGGTRMDVPYDVVPNKMWNDMNPPRGKTDMIVITDGVVPVSDHLADSFNAWREREQVKTITLIIGRSDPKDLRKTSDEIHNVSSIGLNEAGVQSCFSI